MRLNSSSVVGLNDARMAMGTHSLRKVSVGLCD